MHRAYCFTEWALADHRALFFAQNYSQHVRHPYRTYSYYTRSSRSLFTVDKSNEKVYSQKSGTPERFEISPWINISSEQTGAVTSAIRPSTLQKWDTTHFEGGELRLSAFLVSALFITTIIPVLLILIFYISSQDLSTFVNLLT